MSAQLERHKHVARCRCLWRSAWLICCHSAENLLQPARSSTAAAPSSGMKYLRSDSISVGVFIDSVIH